MTVFHDWERTPTAAEARRWQLLAAGRRAILDQGLDSFTIDDVVGLAGLAKGSFYTYFSSRERFLDALRVALAQDIGAAGRQAAAGPWAGLFGRMIGAARDWLVANAPLRALFSATYMANPDRPTKEPLLLLLEEVLDAGIAAAVIQPVGDRTAAGLEATAQLVLDVMREAAGRAAAGDAAAIATAEAFLEGALHYDADAARRAVFPA